MFGKKEERGGVCTLAGGDKWTRHDQKKKRKEIKRSKSSRGYLPNFKSILGGKPESRSHLYGKI